MNHQDQHSQDTANVRIGVFCYKCGKEDFSGNTQSLLSHVCYCKPTSLITSSSINTTKRKHQQDNPSIQFHDAGLDPFSFLVRKRKHFPKDLHPKPRRCLSLELVLLYHKAVASLILLMAKLMISL
jgi:hypothetical protein